MHIPMHRDTFPEGQKTFEFHPYACKPPPRSEESQCGKGADLLSLQLCLGHAIQHIPHIVSAQPGMNSKTHTCQHIVL